MMNLDTSRQIRSLITGLEFFEDHFVCDGRVYGNTLWGPQDLGALPAQLKDRRDETQGTDDSLIRRIDAGLAGDADALIDVLYRLLEKVDS